MADLTFVEFEPPLSEEDLRRVEQQLNIVLPPDIRGHYGKHNGGRPIPNGFPLGDEYFTVRKFLPMRSQSQGLTFEDTYQSLVVEEDRFPMWLVPFAVDAGGDFFCYASTEEKFGQIFFFQGDYYDETDRAVVRLAGNLKEFLDSLVWPLDD